MPVSVPETNIPSDPTNGIAALESLSQFADIFVIDSEVTPAGTNSVDLDEDIPAGGIPLGGSVQCVANAAATTATGLGIGTGSDPDELGELTFANIDAKNDQLVFAANQIAYNTATTPKIFGTNGSGASAGTLDSGTFRVRIWGIVIRPIADVA